MSKFRLEIFASTIESCGCNLFSSFSSLVNKNKNPKSAFNFLLDSGSNLQSMHEKGWLVFMMSGCFPT